MIGQKINKYRIDEKIGEGGMGVVYKAWDAALERWVALKMIHPILAEDEKFLKRFRAEARALAKLENPNIVTVFDLQEAESGLCIVMQFVEGANLAATLQNGPLPVATALPIIKQVLSALCHAHQVGVIHRDIKPSNVMLTAQGLVKITDFGMAKIHAGLSLTQSTSTGGTLYYMPPEQLKSLANVDQRCDIYAAGMTIYEMLAGRLPLEKQENLYALSKAIVESKFCSPDHFNPAIPKDLSAIVMKAIAKEPGRRYQRIEEMLAAIADFEAKQKPAQLPSPSPTRRSKRNVYIAGLLALALLASIVFLFVLPEFFGNRSPSAPSAVVSFSTQASPIETTMVKIDSAEQTMPPATVAPSEVGAVQIDSKPRGAAIFWDGQTYGLTPRTIANATVGNHAIMLKKAGYQDYSVSIIVANGATSKIDAPLLPLAGTLRVIVKPSGEIYIDGERQRENASGSFETDLPVGPHLIKVAHPEFGHWEKQVDVNPAIPQVIEVDFNKFVNITVAVTSGWGEIYVDDQAIGEQTPKKIPLRIGKHVIEVRREGYTMEGQAEEINLEADVEKPFVFTLRKKP